MTQQVARSERKQKNQLTERSEVRYHQTNIEIKPIPMQFS